MRIESTVVRRLVALVLLVVVLAACGSSPQHRGTLPPPQDSSTLGPGDKFEVVVVGEDKFPANYVVAPDGTVDFPWIHRQKVAGYEPQALAAFLGDQLKQGKFLTDPTVIVNVKELGSKRITVSGQVTKPGEVPYTPGLTLYRTIVLAGGFTPLASRNNVLVTRSVAGGGRRTVSFSVEAISDGSAPDVPMQAGDSVYVYERAF